MSKQKKYPNGKTNIIQLTKFGFYVRWQLWGPADFTTQMSPCVMGSSSSASGDALELSRVLWPSQRYTSTQLAVQGFESAQKCCHQAKSSKKKRKKKSTILTVTIPFKVLHHLLPSHFEHSFSEDLIHVHVNAASDQSPSVTQGTAGSREIVNKEVVQEIRRALNPAFRNSLHFHLRHICLFLMITIFWSALPRACRAGEKQIDRELSPLEKNSHFRDNGVV